MQEEYIPDRGRNARRLIYFFAFIAGWPCVLYLMGWLPHYTTNYLVLLGVAAFALLVRNRFSLPRPIFLLLFVQAVAWTLYSALHGMDSSYFTRILMLLITYLILELQYGGGEHRDDFLKEWNLWIVFQVAAGTLGFLLVLAGWLEPVFSFREMDGRPGYFFGLFTTNTFAEGLVRNAGFFDEPGCLAFWGVYALLINKLFVGNRKVELLLVFGLISTMSLAYFVQLILYVHFFYKRQRARLLPYLIVFAVALTWLSLRNEKMNEALFGRIEYNEQTGTIRGDNRSDLTRTCWELFKEAPLTGHGAQRLVDISQARHVFVGANPLLSFAADGIVGQLIIWTPFFFLFRLRRYDPKWGWTFWILMAGFMQRPYDCAQLLYPLLSMSIVLHAYLQERDREYEEDEEEEETCAEAEEESYSEAEEEAYAEAEEKACAEAKAYAVTQNGVYAEAKEKAHSKTEKETNAGMEEEGSNKNGYGQSTGPGS